jgi:hypothetical protein
MRFKVLILSVLISFNVNAKSNAVWKDFYGFPIEGTSYYLNYDSIKKSRDFVYWWQLADYTNPVEGYYSLTKYRQGDCDVMRIKDLSYVFHKGNMGEGEALKLKPEDGWRYPEPLSGDSVILKSTVCAWNQND